MASLRAAGSSTGRTLGGDRMVTFRDYMESALYSSGGFYERRTPMEDFYTAPELHPAFAGILAGWTLERLKGLEERGVPAPYFIVEMGSGVGTLGAGILKALRERHGAWLPKLRYVFVERSESALLKSILSAGSGERVLGYSRLEDVPACSGVFLSNELVDAFPVHLLQKDGGLMREVYVQSSGPGSAGIRGAEGVRAELGELSCPALQAAADKVCPNLAEGGRHAVNLEAARWLKLVGERLTEGTLLTIDYGKRFGAMPNPPRAFYRHSLPETLTSRPGEQDLTASVDFDSLIAKGRALGLGLESFTTLSRFLLDRGIERWLEAGDTAAALKSRSQVKTLLHPEGMGEAFKVLIQRKGGNPASC